MTSDYGDTLIRYEKDAGRWKRWSRIFIATSIGTSVCLSLVGIVGMMVQFSGRTVPLTLVATLIALGTAGFVITIADIVINPRMRWMAYREAVHRLWRLAMFTRADLDPSGEPLNAGSDRRLLFETELLDIKTHIDKNKRDWFEVQGLCSLLNFPELLKTWQSQLRRVWELPEPEFSGPAAPHLPADNPLDILPGADDYLIGRLDSQVRWFLRKARINRNWYLGLNGFIATLYALMGLYFIFWGRAFWLSVACSAFIMGTNMLIGFLNCRPLWEQYRTTGRQLIETRERFMKHSYQGSGTASNHDLQQLVRDVEDLLETEFYFWHAIHQQARPASFSLRPCRHALRGHG